MDTKSDMQLDENQWLELIGKVNEIYDFLHGRRDAPGLAQTVSEHTEVLNGNAHKGTVGLITKVTVLWKSYIWIACTLSGVIGYFLKELFTGLHK